MLQFAALLGEEDAASVIQSSGLQSAFSSPEALFGLADKEAPWDELVVESRPGVMTYRAYKRPLRRGINMYWTVSVMEDASVQELRRFTLDDQNRSKWDDNCMGCIQLLPPEPLGPSPPHETCFVYLKAKFPRPMAARDYVYARRVVDCPEGGGAYIVQVPCLEGRHPSFQQLSGRIVRVSDFTSCTRIRAVKSPSGRQEGAVELSMIYFEDSKVRTADEFWAPLTSCIVPGFAEMYLGRGLFMRPMSFVFIFISPVVAEVADQGREGTSIGAGKRRADRAGYLLDQLGTVGAVEE